MQDEMNRECFAIVIDGAKMTTQVLARAMKLVLDEKGAIPGKNSFLFSGETSLKRLAESGMKLSNIEITEKNIKSFEHTAREYGITYALKKDVSTDPPRYLVFFKAKDRMQVEAAFKSYVREAMGDKNRETFSAALSRLAEKASKIAVKVPHQERGGR